MSTIRRERRQEQLVRELSEIIQNGLKDPRRSWISVTRVDLSSDMKFARVHVSVLGDQDRRNGALSMLEGAAHFIRGQLGRRLKIRHVPDVRFVLDESMEASQRVMEILDSLDIPAEPEPGDASRPEGLGEGDPD